MPRSARGSKGSFDTRKGRVDNVEVISGYPASDFIGSCIRTFASVIHPEDRQAVELGVDEGLARKAFRTPSHLPAAARPAGV